MKMFGIEITMVSAVGALLILHAANHLWAVQSIERTSGAMKTVMFVALIVAAGAFAFAGLILVGKIALDATVATCAAAIGAALSMAVIALAGNAELNLGYAANALFLAAAIVAPRLAAVAVR
jgi:hypothetical protein